MNKDQALPIEDRSVQRSRYCCLAHIRLLLQGDRIRHQSGIASRQPIAAPDENAEQDVVAATAHDFYCAELEASQLTAQANSSYEPAIRHDSPQELTRARRVFALTLLIPMLLMSAALLLFGSAPGRAMVSLLQFSVFALAIPLAASAGAWLVRAFRHQRAQ